MNLTVVVDDGILKLAGIRGGTRSRDPAASSMPPIRATTRGNTGGGATPALADMQVVAVWPSRSPASLSRTASRPALILRSPGVPVSQRMLWLPRWFLMGMAGRERTSFGHGSGHYFRNDVASRRPAAVRAGLRKRCLASAISRPMVSTRVRAKHEDPGLLRATRCQKHRRLPNTYTA